MAGIQAQTYPHIQVTALDNASSDDVVGWLRESTPDVTVIESTENLGYGRGHNAIIAACNLQDGDYYMALNPDAQLEPTYIEELVREIEARGAGWGIGQLRLMADDGTPTDLLYSMGHGILSDGYAFNIGYQLPQHVSPKVPQEVFGAPGAAVIYTADLIADLSRDGAFFDSDLFLYYEDVDVDWRAQARGWRCLYVPTAVAWHRGSQPSGNLRMQSLANRYGVAIKNATTAALWFGHLPRMIFHVGVRLMVTPSNGKAFLSHLSRVIPQMWRKRKLISRRPITGWVQWSAQQPTGQPRSLGQRWYSFRQRG